VHNKQLMLQQLPLMLPNLSMELTTQTWLQEPIVTQPENGAWGLLRVLPVFAE